MLSLIGKALEPDSTTSDKSTYLTCLEYLQSIKDESQVHQVSGTIQDLLAGSHTRFTGLVLLQIALKQNPEIFFKRNWHIILFKILKEPESYLLKTEACKTLKLILTILAKDPSNNSETLHKYISFLIPFSIEIDDDNEWAVAAYECLAACLKLFPTECKSYEQKIMLYIIRKFDLVSSVTFEPLAECFCELPNCSKTKDPNTYEEAWMTQYASTINTLHYIISKFNLYMLDDKKFGETGRIEYFQLDEPEDVYSCYMSYVRQFINVCKCLSKFLSTKTRHPVRVNTKEVIECLSRLFHPGDIANLKDTTVENKILMSGISQMQVAALIVLEPLILNFNIAVCSIHLHRILENALMSSYLPNISSEEISPIRHTVWKLINIWLSAYTSTASREICKHPEILEEMLKDINIESAPFSKNAVSNSESKNDIGINYTELVCKEALKVLEKVIYTGASFLPEKIIEEIASAVLIIAYAVHPSYEPPVPYNNDSCRKHLYELLTALAVVSKPNHSDFILAAATVFNNALQDTSIKVSSVSLKAKAITHLFLHPMKPPPVVKIPEEKLRNKVSNSMKYVEWSPEEKYIVEPVENIPNASENITQRGQAFQHSADSEIHSNEYMQVDGHYSEQTSEEQCNGDDILEIQNSSHCEEEEESEDDDEVDEEEDDGDRSFCEEEVNQEVSQKQMYMPETNELQVMTPVCITTENAQNATEQEEFEELKPCEKTDFENANDSSPNKNVQLNGMIDEEMPSASAQSVANENGIYNSEEEEIVGDEEEEEEEQVSHPSEKKAPPEFYPTPSKRPRLDEEEEMNNESKVENDDEEDERMETKSPTLEEMKTAFVLSSVEDVKS